MKNPIIALGVACLLTGCSVSKALTQPGPADLEGIGVGTSRQDMIGRLGMPSLTDTLQNGQRQDYFQFQSGAHPASKARAIPYLAADVFTLGLAELLLWPLELTALEAATCQGVATYDSHLKVSAWSVAPKAGQSTAQGC